MLVLHRLALSIRRCRRDIAAQSVLYRVFDQRIGPYALEAATLDHAGGERMAADHSRIGTQHHFDFECGEFAPVEHPTFAELPRRGTGYFGLAEIVFAAGIQRKIGRQLVAVFLQITDQAAVMVEVAVTQDQTLHFRIVDAEDLHVVGERIGGVAIVEQQIARFTALARFEREREPPLVVQRFSEIGGPDAGALDLDPFRLWKLRRVVAAVGHHFDDQTVDDRDGTAFE